MMGKRFGKRLGELLDDKFKDSFGKILCRRFGESWVIERVGNLVSGWEEGLVRNCVGCLII